MTTNSLPSVQTCGSDSSDKTWGHITGLRRSVSTGGCQRLKEQEMKPEERSLRWLIDKWLAPTPATPVRVTRYGRANPHPRRCVLAQSSGPAGPLEIFFFRHDDGSWCVFPPASSGPVMHAYPRVG